MFEENGKFIKGVVELNIESGSWFDFGVEMSHIWKKSSTEKWGICSIVS